MRVQRHLSYQRNQSIGWAILHFFLAVFYYPYFAFTQGGSSTSAAASTESSPSCQPFRPPDARMKKWLAGKRK
jgi:hypothetical protein